MAENKKARLDGILRIKPEFRRDALCVKQEQAQNNSTDVRQKKKQRGQNKAKARRVDHCKDSIKICHSVALGLVCENNDCNSTHDIKEYLESKEPDLGSVCPIFETYGRCKYGLRCRFMSAHTDKDGYQVVKDVTVDSSTVIKNTITTPELKDIRKDGKLFKSKQVEVLWELSEGRGNLDELVTSSLDDLGNEMECKLRPVERKRLDLKGKTYLAPLQNVGNLPFRRICKEFGVDITCTEMILSQSLLNWTKHEWSLMKKHQSEDFFGIQITGNHPITFTRALECINQKFEFDFIDINLGCPVDSITSGGSGSALMEKRSKLQWMIRGANHVLDCPVTVKMRTAVRDKKLLADTLIPLVKSWGASAVTLHGRSKEQRYTKLADWDYIQKCGEGISDDSFCYFGNGDVCNPDDYFTRLRECSNIEGVMIGRGALVKPWIFKEIKEGKLYDISANERLDILKRFANYGIEIWGSDTMVKRFK